MSHEDRVSEYPVFSTSALFYMQDMEVYRCPLLNESKNETFEMSIQSKLRTLEDQLKLYNESCFFYEDWNWRP